LLLLLLMIRLLLMVLRLVLVMLLLLLAHGVLANTAERKEVAHELIVFLRRARIKRSSAGSERTRKLRGGKVRTRCRVSRERDTAGGRS
jgi:hypothetical protein